MIRKVVMFLVVAAIFSACGAKKAPVPEKVYEEAMSLYKRKSFEDSVDAFKKVKELFPEHPLAQQAQILVGEANFKAEKYEDAVLAYDEFVKLYPFNINVPYARYKEALCFYKQISDKEREQNFTRQAVDKFLQLINNFPDSPYAVKAHEHIKDCRSRIAEQEVYIGNFYLRNKKYKAAEKRFFFALKNFADVSVQEDAIYGLFRVYKMQGDEKKAKNLVETLMFYFPNSKYKKDMLFSMSRK
jgi:outer membrane protein assembly factor BamD